MEKMVEVGESYLAINGNVFTVVSVKTEPRRTDYPVEASYRTKGGSLSQLSFTIWGTFYSHNEADDSDFVKQISKEKNPEYFL